MNMNVKKQKLITLDFGFTNAELAILREAYNLLDCLLEDVRTAHQIADNDEMVSLYQDLYETNTLIKKMRGYRCMIKNELDQ